MRVGITGHQDLPVAAVQLLTDALLVLVEQQGDLVAVCSLAVGADQIAARAVVAGGGRLEAVIPCREYSATFDHAGRIEYEALLDVAIERRELPFVEPSEAAFLAAGLVVVERSDLLLAAWDGLPAKGLGGTSDVVAYAKQIGRPVTVVWPDGARRGE